MPPKYVWYNDPLLDQQEAIMRFKLEVTYMNQPENVDPKNTVAMLNSKFV